ncbi:PIN domain-containing protein [Roseitranquillus sediminis]|uniref:PIN domain-containing protein n=1 Tax=Roseitranquillus sediminis TaxID=2809051 RepID=UPI001D0C82D8|nr:type II toxin-antitoxin system VapC family toxin [Roseitranquillus sediminis]MBM9593904.1 type II toxin-antitoxin system VapC family toxin [Roseitranquillus sediminis]
MIALDTNILVRILVGDDTAQEHLAQNLVGGLTPEVPGFVAREVLVELAWVLRRVYRLPRGEICNALEGVLSTSTFAVETADDAARALDAYRAGAADFADLMILAAARRAGAALVTLDRKLGGQDGATLLEGA